MSEYDPRCVNCLHRSHEDKECPYCPMPTKENPNSRCTEFTRADLFVARAMARIEQHSMQAHGQLMMALSTIFDLLSEAYPEAAERLKAKLEAQRVEEAKELEEMRAKAKVDAAEALEQAKAGEEQQFMDDLAKEYVGESNVLSFPTKPNVIVEDGGTA